MALSTPRYILEAVDPDAPTGFEWNDVNPAGAYAHQVVSLENKLAKLPKRAIAAFAVACAEWVDARLTKQAASPVPCQYIEAAWAAIADWRYHSGVARPPRTDWQGPVRGPLWEMMLDLQQALNQARRLKPVAYHAVCIANLAEYVLVASGPFKKWRKIVVERLLTLYPLDPGDKLGPTVPREALDPDFDFSPAMTNDLMQKFLAGLQFDANPYIQRPEAAPEV